MRDLTRDYISSGQLPRRRHPAEGEIRERVTVKFKEDDTRSPACQGYHRVEVAWDTPEGVLVGFFTDNGSRCEELLHKLKVRTPYGVYPPLMMVDLERAMSNMMNLPPNITVTLDPTEAPKKREGTRFVEEVKEPKKNKDKSMFDLLILPDEHKNRILEVINQTDSKVKEQIFKKWGFDKTIEKGKGMIMLFFGLPGTGKTMCAEAIAKMVGKDHVILNSGDFQSSVPGDTERKMKQAFEKAKQEDLVLILDECDSLLYSRQEVGAIFAAEINALLTEIERFEGICIMTTNRYIRLDEALDRRVALKLEFPAPDKTARKEIWRKLIPKECPLEKDLSFENLAEFNLTGGEIKNAILTAARRAAIQKAEVVSFADFEVGIKLEIENKKQRVGKPQFLGMVEDMRQELGFTQIVKEGMNGKS